MEHSIVGIRSRLESGVQLKVDFLCVSCEFEADIVLWTTAFLFSVGGAFSSSRMVCHLLAIAACVFVFSFLIVPFYLLYIWV